MLFESPATGPAAAKGGQVPAPPPVAAPPPRRRVLVVDDNEDAAATLAVLLTLVGHQTHVAHDGVEAQTVAAACRPDVVLLDIGLPKLSGHEVARWLRTQPWGQDLTLVAVTALDQERFRLESRRSGFDAHLVKPVDLHTLEGLLAGLQALRT